ncbi:MAG: MobC family plasmid mobilization relaxosome protein [Clostridiales bacterium]|nr:MobC family plasmid mobilization relaxosome protein [Clostridiales bacterium]
MVGRKRNHNFSVRLNDSKIKLVRQKIKKSGLSQREFLVRCVSEKEVYSNDGIKSVIKSFIVELNRVGNNINQIARRINSGQIYDTAQCADELTKMWDTLKEIREGVSKWQF